LWSRSQKRGTRAVWISCEAVPRVTALTLRRLQDNLFACISLGQMSQEPGTRDHSTVTVPAHIETYVLAAQTPFCMACDSFWGEHKVSLLTAYLQTSHGNILREYQMGFSLVHFIQQLWACNWGSTGADNFTTDTTVPCKKAYSFFYQWICGHHLVTSIEYLTIHLVRNIFHYTIVNVHNKISCISKQQGDVKIRVFFTKHEL
jgi:hypothetical protein